MAGTAAHLERPPVADVGDEERDAFACRIAEIVARTPIDGFIDHITQLLDRADARRKFREAAEGAD